MFSDQLLEKIWFIWREVTKFKDNEFFSLAQNWMLKGRQLFISVPCIKHSSGEWGDIQFCSLRFCTMHTEMAAHRSNCDAMCKLNISHITTNNNVWSKDTGHIELFSILLCWVWVTHYYNCTLQKTKEKQLQICVFVDASKQKKSKQITIL